MTNDSISRDDIMKIIPHRPPMLLLDEGELIDGISTCKYTVKGDEFFLQGHFPGNPVVPGVIQCEMMAQASCLLVGESPTHSSPAPLNGTARHHNSTPDNNHMPNRTPYFTGMEKVKFKRKVIPGDCLVLRSELVKQKGPFYFVKCTGHVNDELCCTAEISFALM